MKHIVMWIIIALLEFIYVHFMTVLICNCLDIEWRLGLSAAAFIVYIMVETASNHKD